MTFTVGLLWGLIFFKGAQYGAKHIGFVQYMKAKVFLLIKLFIRFHFGRFSQIIF